MSQSICLLDYYPQYTLFHLVTTSMSSPATSSPSPPVVEPASVALDSIQWTDIVEDENGKAVGISGIEWKDFSSKQLRTICSRLSVRGVKNAKKSDMIERLVTFYENKKAYTALQTRERAMDKAPRQQVQCSFRLVNALFSDKFAGDFANLGNVASRAILDAGKAAHDQHFWEKVRADFVTSDENYDVMRFQDDYVIALDCS